MNCIVLKVVVQLTFMYSYNEGVRRWRDKPTVTVNQVSHVFCCGQWCRSDCEGLCTHIQISTREKDSALLHSDTMRALLWMSLTNAHMHAHTDAFFAASLASSTDPLKYTLKRRHIHLYQFHTYYKSLYFCVKKLWLRINNASEDKIVPIYLQKLHEYIGCVQGVRLCAFTSGAPATLSCNMPFLSLSSSGEYWIDWTWLKLAKCVGCRIKQT